ncbi:hypothetical protein SO802_015599 [Lithocarpus litseifolius]|uniref:RNase H type-1 domain-containing protein n=1 Tax=Lithocarpus litseifolius TaxID=425828 RepID=A0AAW2CU47_9ROSI
MATSLMYSIVYTIERPVQERIPQLIRWTVPPDPYIRLNTDGSAIGNPWLASAGGILCDSSGGWFFGFSSNLGIITNNMAELAALWQGLLLAWDLGFKFIQIELDSSTVLSWLTNRHALYPPDMMSLIYDCRSLMEQEWEMQAGHIYREANGCADALAK